MVSGTSAMIGLDHVYVAFRVDHPTEIPPQTWCPESVRAATITIGIAVWAAASGRFPATPWNRWIASPIVGPTSWGR
jgi:hypothetical protein